MRNDGSDQTEKLRRLKELALLFTRLGATAFGGPAAHVAFMEDEVVRRREWLTRDEFLDLLGMTNLIPGPNSTELAIHIGFQRAGWAGLLVAGSCFILPATFIVMAVAWAYTTYGALPQALAIMEGVKPVVIAVVVQALWGLGKSSVKNKELAVVGAMSLLLLALNVNELAVLAVAAGAAMVLERGAGAKQGGFISGGLLLGQGVPISAGVAFGLSPLFWTFVKIGSVLFGSGYVLLAFLRADFVERLHWLSEAQLLDAVAVGQLTPGPVFTTATFIGYVLGGPSAAMLATAGIFLPAFVFVGLSGLLVPWIRKSPMLRKVLDGVNVASLALMASVTLELGRAALTTPVNIAVGVVSGILLFRYRVNSAWLVLGGAAISMVNWYFRGGR